jgi:hypothetical protein
LPSKTNTGANTMGFLTDGKVFTARGECNYNVGLNLQSNCVEADFDIYNPQLLRLYGRNDYFDQNQPGKLFFLLEMDTSRARPVKIIGVNFWMGELQQEILYTLDTLQKNELNINPTINRNGFYGTFTLYLKNTTGKSKVLYNGRFDIAL